MHPDIAVFGSGHLAEQLARALAEDGKFSGHVALIGRNEKRLREICCISDGIARLRDSTVSFAYHAVDLTDSSAIATVLDTVQPAMAICCVSNMSPREYRAGTSAWNDFLRAARFGVTLPLQLQTAQRIAACLAASGSVIPFVNGCYPDGANPILSALGLDVYAGMGNLATISAFVTPMLSGPSRQHVRLLGNHAHFNGRVAPELMAWDAHHAALNVDSAMALFRQTYSATFSALAALSAAKMIRCYFNGESYTANMSGVLGLEGGYPVIMQEKTLSLDLPPGYSLNDARQMNIVSLASEGFVFEKNRVYTPQAASRFLSQFGIEYDEYFEIDRLDVAAAKLIAIRTALETVPSAGPA